MCWFCQVTIDTSVFRLRRFIRRLLRTYSTPREIAVRFARRLDPQILLQWSTMDDVELERHEKVAGCGFRLEYGLWDDDYPFHQAGGVEATTVEIFRHVRNIADELVKR